MLKVHGQVGRGDRKERVGGKGRERERERERVRMERETLLLLNLTSVDRCVGDHIYWFGLKKPT